LLATALQPTECTFRHYVPCVEICSLGAFTHAYTLALVGLSCLFSGGCRYHKLVKNNRAHFQNSANEVHRCKKNVFTFFLFLSRFFYVFNVFILSTLLFF